MLMSRMLTRHCRVLGRDHSSTQGIRFLASMPPSWNGHAWTLGLLLATTASRSGSHSGHMFVLSLDDDDVCLLRNACVCSDTTPSCGSHAQPPTEDNPDKEAGQGSSPERRRAQRNWSLPDWESGHWSQVQLQNGVCLPVSTWSRPHRTCCPHKALSHTAEQHAFSPVHGYEQRLWEEKDGSSLQLGHFVALDF